MTKVLSYNHIYVTLSLMTDYNGLTNEKTAWNLNILAVSSQRWSGRKHEMLFQMLHPCSPFKGA